MRLVLPELCETRHHREGVGWAWTEEVKRRPGLPQRMLEQEFDGVDGDISGVGGELFVVTEEQELLAEFIFGDGVG